MFLKKQFLLIFLLITVVSFAQPRAVLNFNQGWQFAKRADNAKSANWQQVNLPHTWNVDDVMDDEPGYYRGVGLYKKRFRIDPEWVGKELSIYFEGANQKVEVYINNKKAGEHKGGYTGFSIGITSLVKYDTDNEILVKVDNSFDENIPPLTADFSFYGGIYRDVFLVATSNIHFSDEQGACGVFISTPFVSTGEALTTVRSHVSNQTKLVSKIKVVTTLFDSRNMKLSQTTGDLSIQPNSNNSIVQKIPAVKKPGLWSPEEPNLYSVETKLVDAKGRTIDIVKNSLGFRWFRFSADSGFFLNGKPYKLTGASRHQDYKGLGNAVPDVLAINDVVLLKNMGANFLRVAHYPQDACVLRACDSLGILASVEIPVVNEITESAAFSRNCGNMLVEMIRQNYNHPSVILWGYMNEVLLKPHFNDNKEKQLTYFSNINQLARNLETICRKEDPYRVTFMANHGNLESYKKAGLLEVPMVVGWNLYSGWYGGTMKEFPAFLDDFHKAYPARPFLVAEYGADADPRIRNDQPVRFDKSIEYTTKFHQYYFNEMRRRPFVSGAVIWNLADFNSETRTESMPHINNKGLLEWDRTPKDPYYFYKAVLSKKPFIKILGSFNNHYGIADSNASVCYLPVQVATNMDSVTLTLNGQKQTSLKVIDGLCEFRLPFLNGQNELTATGKRSMNGKNDEVKDRVVTKVHLQAACLTDPRFRLQQMNIMLGSSRYYLAHDGAWWQPDQEYRKGYWGSLGGKRFRLLNNSRLPYGTDKNIVGTNDDPVYQTQSTGIRQYRFDIPAGKYEVSLHFAELLGGVVKVPPYNLSEGERKDEIKQRIFNVAINGRRVLDHLNIAKDYGLATPVVKSFTVVVGEDEGISIDFEPVEGEPVLNALQLKKIAGDADR